MVKARGRCLGDFVEAGGKRQVMLKLRAVGLQDFPKRNFEVDEMFVFAAKMQREQRV